MSLFLIELPLPAEAERDATFRRIADATDRAHGELIELQLGLDTGRLYVIAEHDSGAALTAAFTEAGLVGAGSLGADASEVRLVGPTLDEVKAARGAAGYIVEWDLPAGLGMEEYIARKRAKAPGYAKVPETTFLRTYVCVDMSKCLCFYRAPDEEAVLRARAAVETPVDRLTRIEEVPQHARA